MTKNSPSGGEAIIDELRLTRPDGSVPIGEVPADGRRVEAAGRLQARVGAQREQAVLGGVGAGIATPGRRTRPQGKRKLAARRRGAGREGETGPLTLAPFHVGEGVGGLRYARRQEQGG